METKTSWPGNVQDKPTGWGDWSEEARAAFAKLWESADEKMKLGYLEDIRERQGNQKDMEEYFLYLSEYKGGFEEEDDEECGAIGCSMMVGILILIVPAIILKVFLG